MHLFTQSSSDPRQAKPLCYNRHKCLRYLYKISHTLTDLQLWKAHIHTFLDSQHGSSIIPLWLCMCMTGIALLQHSAVHKSRPTRRENLTHTSGWPPYHCQQEEPLHAAGFGLASGNGRSRLMEERFHLSSRPLISPQKNLKRRQNKKPTCLHGRGICLQCVSLLGKGPQWSEGREAGRERGHETDGAVFVWWEKCHNGQFLYFTVAQTAAAQNDVKGHSE